MTEGMNAAATPELAARRKELTPKIDNSFESYSRTVFAEGAAAGEVKQLIAVAFAHVTQCPYGITGHHSARSLQRGTPGGTCIQDWLCTPALGDGAAEHTVHRSGSPQHSPT